jgi:hypothetical protein
MSTLHRNTFPLSLLCACLSAQACSSSSDELNPVSVLPDSSADAPNDAGSEADALLEATEAAEATGEAASEAAGDSLAPDAAIHRYALLVGSDYASKAELSVVDLETATLAGRISSDDQDTLAAASLGRGFLLHRTQGKVSILDPANPSVAQSVIDVSPAADSGKANPYAVVVSAGIEGYVIRYGQNSIPVVDLTTGTVQATVDLSQFVSDKDGLVDAFDGVFDVTQGRVYVGLQRVDQTEFGPAPDFVGTCKPEPSLVVAIDVATHQLVDLNGAADGLGIELLAANPSSMVWDEASRSIGVLGVGCSEATADGGTTRSGRGVEQVKIDQAQTSWLWQTHELDRPWALLWMSGQSAIVGLDDAMYVRHWWLWDPSKADFTKELHGVPGTPAYDGASGLVGIAPATNDAGSGLDIVRYDFAAETSQVLVANAFSVSGLSAYSSAVIR